MGTTLGDLLANARGCDATPAGGAVRFLSGFGKATTLSYGDLITRAMRVAAYLRRRGLRPGQCVAIVSGTHPDFVAGFFGVILAGGVPCALYPPLRLGRLDEWQTQTLAALKRIEAAHVLVERRFQGVLQHALAGTTLPVTILDTLQDYGDTLFDPSDDATSVAVIQLSSGTTGTPKPVCLTHRNILANLADIRALLPETPGRHPSGVSWLPLYHDMGLFGKLFMGFATQGALTLIPPELFLAKPLIWLEELTRSRASISAAPNFAFGLCVKRITGDISHLDLSSWKMAICGAEAVQRHTFDAFTERFQSVGFDPTIFSPAYGLAEATLALTCVPATRTPSWTSFQRETLTRHGLARHSDKNDHEALALASLGKPLASVTLRIVDDADHDLAEGVAGRVLAKGASVTCETWFDTGDRGFLHDGELYLLGRTKDTVILNGRNFDPALIEAVAQRVPGVRQGCVVVFSANFDGDDSEGLVILAEREAPSPRSDEDVQADVCTAVRQDLQIAPKACVILDQGSLPRTSSGKLRRAEAKHRWQNKNLAPPKRFGAARFLIASQLGKLRPRSRKATDAKET